MDKELLKKDFLYFNPGVHNKDLTPILFFAILTTKRVSGKFEI